MYATSLTGYLMYYSTENKILKLHAFADVFNLTYDALLIQAKKCNGL